MGIVRDFGVPITLDCDRRLIFNINVLEQCIEKYGSISAMLDDPMDNLAASVWIAVAMLNEDAEIWNDEHPESPKTLVNEKILKRYTVGVGGINEIQKKVKEALLQGLPEDKLQEVEEAEKNLIAVQSGKILRPNRAQRRVKK